ncbi:hypothetical protein HY949_05425 [Candidatus Gottesmanbacteria bacterium]|nr:hypothetical protein [Candidatus Gottesmanbacteria bacterium]
MRRGVARIKGLGYILWHTRHHAYHLLIGLAWAWLLREVWGEFQPKWIILSLIASELPDIDHVLYFFTYGKQDPYSKLVKTLFVNRQWRMLWYTIDTGHKYNTNLATHNYFTILVLTTLSLIAFIFERQSSVVFLGSMVLHYCFDILDDLLILGSVNANWKRWGSYTVKR